MAFSTAIGHLENLLRMSCWLDKVMFSSKAFGEPAFVVFILVVIRLSMQDSLRSTLRDPHESLILFLQ